MGYTHSIGDQDSGIGLPLMPQSWRYVGSSLCPFLFWGSIWIELKCSTPGLLGLFEYLLLSVLGGDFGIGVLCSFYGALLLELRSFSLRGHVGDAVGCWGLSISGGVVW